MLMCETSKASGTTMVLNTGPAVPAGNVIGVSADVKDMHADWVCCAAPGMIKAAVTRIRSAREATCSSMVLPDAELREQDFLFLVSL